MSHHGLWKLIVDVHISHSEGVWFCVVSIVSDIDRQAHRSKYIHEFMIRFTSIYLPRRRDRLCIAVPLHVTKQFIVHRLHARSCSAWRRQDHNR